MLCVAGDRVLVDGGPLRPATLHIQEGRIAKVGDFHDRPAGVPVLDARGLVVMPGLVDTHVHINEPGRTDWEGFESATRAAAAGGVTTLVDMPLNSIPATTTVAALETKVRAAEGKCHVDVAFWGGVVPGNTGELEALARAGVRGYKCFLSPSGVDEFEHVGAEDLRRALPVLARLGLPLLVHAELPALLLDVDPRSDPRSYLTWLASRPLDAEREAIAMLRGLAEDADAHIHIVHLSAADGALGRTGAGPRRGVVTTETCPHYLTFAAEDIADGATPFKCAPPIRARDHRERLWQALRAGEIDLIATDHSPAPPELKRLGDGDFVRAWGGIASLQLGLRVVWSGAAARGFGLEDIARWMARAPARLAKLDDRKGTIAAGLDADLVIWDPDLETRVDPVRLQHRHPVTPYAGMRLKGAVRRTLVRGEMVYEEGKFLDAPRGRPLLHGMARR